LGDADLFVSGKQDLTQPTILQYTYASRSQHFLDQVTITDSVNKWLEQELYFSIYG